VSVETGVTRMGTKSFDFEYRVVRGDGVELATGRTVQVAYDYPRGESIPIPDAWRRAMAAFEGELPAFRGASSSPEG
jgi:acyl-CoA thioesterase FadM